MKLRKKHITTALATLLLASPLYFSTENKTEATSYNKEISDYLLKENAVHFKALNSPLEIKEVKVIGKRIPKLEELDNKEDFYLNKNQVKEYVNSVYNKINPPQEISEHLFMKLLQKESGFNIYAHHKKSNARGLGQIRKKTWETLEKKVSYKKGVYNPSKNIEVSLNFLKWLENYNEKFNPKWDTLKLEKKQAYILASYNWGPGNLKRAHWNLKKAPAETKDYINYILKN